MVVGKLGQADNKSYTVDSTFRNGMSVYLLQFSRRTYILHRERSISLKWLVHTPSYVLTGEAYYEYVPLGV